MKLIKEINKDTTQSTTHLEHWGLHPKNKQLQLKRQLTNQMVSTHGHAE